MSDTSERDERRYAGVKMSVYGAMLPGAARLARLPAESSTEAKRRLKVVQWCKEHEGKVRLTARPFGYSPDTISRWVQAYNSGEVRGLEPKSRRPRRVRQPQASVGVVERVRAVREQYPRWGREKLRVLLAEEGITLSAKSIDRVMGCLKARGVLREQYSPARSSGGSTRGYDDPRGLVVDSPGALVQMDSKHVSLGNGKVVYQFGAVDYFTRKRVVALAPRLTSHHGAEFLRQVVAQFPFQVQAQFPFQVQAHYLIQSDGGSELPEGVRSC